MIDNTKRSSATYVTKVLICGKHAVTNQKKPNSLNKSQHLMLKKKKMAVTDLDEENEDV